MSIKTKISEILEEKTPISESGEMGFNFYNPSEEDEQILDDISKIAKKYGFEIEYKKFKKLEVINKRNNYSIKPVWKIFNIQNRDFRLCVDRGTVSRFITLSSALDELKDLEKTVNFLNEISKKYPKFVFMDGLVPNFK